MGSGDAVEAAGASVFTVSSVFNAVLGSAVPVTTSVEAAASVAVAASVAAAASVVAAPSVAATSSGDVSGSVAGGSGVTVKSIAEASVTAGPRSATAPSLSSRSLGISVGPGGRGHRWVTVQVQSLTVTVELLFVEHSYIYLTLDH